MNGKTLLDYWLIIYERKLLIVCVVLSSVLAAMYISTQIGSIYQAKAVFFIPNRPDVMNYLSGTADTIRTPLSPFPSEEIYIPYIGILESKSLTKRVYNEFPHKSVEDHGRDIDFVLSNEYMIEVYARDKDSAVSADIANAFIRHFNDLIGEYSEPIGIKNESMIVEEIMTVMGKLTRARMELKKFQEEQKIADLSAEIQQLVTIKTQFESRLQSTEITEKENNSRLKELKRQIESEAASFSRAGLLIESPRLDKLKNQLGRVESTMTKLKAKGKDNSKQFILLKDEYKEIENLIVKEILATLKLKIKAPGTFYGNIREKVVNLLVEEQRIKASIQAYKDEISDLDKRIKKIPQLMIKLDILRSDMVKYKNILQILEIKLEEAKMQRRRRPQLVVVVDEAKAPEDAAFPGLLINMLVAGSIGLIMGIFYCFFTYYLEETKQKRIFEIIRAIKESEKDATTEKQRINRAN